MATPPHYNFTENTTETNSGFIIKLVIFVVLLVIILVSTGYMKKLLVFISPDIENCKSGTCRSLCIKGEEIQKQGAKCSDTSKICCIKNELTPSPECNGRGKGEPCGKLMLCDENAVCMSRCEYCSFYPDDKSCSVAGNIIGKSVDKFDSTFACGCTDMDCITIDGSRMGTCVKGFCPSDNPVATDYMCCSTLYNK